MPKKHTVLEVMQFETDLTGSKLIDETQIIQGLAHKSIKEYAYIRHDKDSDKDGNLKRPHWHVVIKLKPLQDIETVAKWFNVPPQQIEIPSSPSLTYAKKFVFFDKVQYLTHEAENQQKKGKYRYPDEDVKFVFVQFQNFRNFIDYYTEEKIKYDANRAKYGRDISPKEELRYDVRYEGLTLRQAQERNRFLYIEDMEKLKKLRMDYISDCKPPVTRINYYIQGSASVGKGLISRAIARSLFPQYTEDEDIFFMVGGKGAAFEGYDGQPVIIWNDRRAIDLLQELNGRGNVFNVFDTHPTKQRQNVKYGSINLCNAVNIVNSVQPYVEFLDGLAGEYKDKDGNLQEVEDKGQSYRRFPFMIVLHEEDFDLLLNKGFIENTKDFEEYIQYTGIRGNMQRIAERCGANEQLAYKLQNKAVKPIADKHIEVLEKFSQLTEDEDTILQEFKDVGTFSDSNRIFSEFDELEVAPNKYGPF